jgi:hypothetical protein
MYVGATQKSLRSFVLPPPSPLTAPKPKPCCACIFLRHSYTCCAVVCSRNSTAAPALFVNWAALLTEERLHLCGFPPIAANHTLDSLCIAPLTLIQELWRLATTLAGRTALQRANMETTSSIQMQSRMETRLDNVGVLTDDTRYWIKSWCKEEWVSSPLLSKLAQLLLPGDMNTLENRIALVESIVSFQIYLKIMTDGNSTHHDQEPQRSLQMLEDVRIKYLNVLAERARPFFEARRRVLESTLGIDAVTVPVADYHLYMRFLHEQQLRGEIPGPAGSDHASETQCDINTPFVDYLTFLSVLPQPLIPHVYPNNTALQSDAVRQHVLKMLESDVTSRNVSDLHEYIKKVAPDLLAEAANSGSNAQNALTKAQTLLTAAQRQIMRSMDGSLSSSLPHADQEYYSRCIVLGDSFYTTRALQQRHMIASSCTTKPLIHPALYKFYMENCTHYNTCSLAHEARRTHNGPVLRDRWWCVFTGDIIDSPMNGCYMVWFFALHPPVVVVVSYEYFRRQQLRALQRLVYNKQEELSPFEREFARYFKQFARFKQQVQQLSEHDGVSVLSAVAEEDDNDDSTMAHQQQPSSVESDGWAFINAIVNSAGAASNAAPAVKPPHSKPATGTATTTTTTTIPTVLADLLPEAAIDAPVDDHEEEETYTNTHTERSHPPLSAPSDGMADVELGDDTQIPENGFYPSVGGEVDVSAQQEEDDVQEEQPELEAAPQQEDEAPAAAAAEFEQHAQTPEPFLGYPSSSPPPPRSESENHPKESEHATQQHKPKYRRCRRPASPPAHAEVAVISRSSESPPSTPQPVVVSNINTTMPVDAEEENDGGSFSQHVLHNERGLLKRAISKEVKLQLAKIFQQLSTRLTAQVAAVYYHDTEHAKAILSDDADDVDDMDVVEEEQDVPADVGDVVDCVSSDPDDNNDNNDNNNNMAVAISEPPASKRVKVRDELTQHPDRAFPKRGVALDAHIRNNQTQRAKDMQKTVQKYAAAVASSMDREDSGHEHHEDQEEESSEDLFPDAFLGGDHGDQSSGAEEVLASDDSLHDFVVDDDMVEYMSDAERDILKPVAVSAASSTTKRLKKKRAIQEDDDDGASDNGVVVADDDNDLEHHQSNPKKRKLDVLQQSAVAITPKRDVVVATPKEIAETIVRYWTDPERVPDGYSCLPDMEPMSDLIADVVRNIVQYVPDFADEKKQAAYAQICETIGANDYEEIVTKTRGTVEGPIFRALCELRTILFFLFPKTLLPAQIKDQWTSHGRRWVDERDNYDSWSQKWFVADGFQECIRNLLTDKRFTTQVALVSSRPKERSDDATKRKQYVERMLKRVSPYGMALVATLFMMDPDA